jgi:hypothetical protein
LAVWLVAGSAQWEAVYSRPREGFDGMAGGRRSAMGGCSRLRAGFGRCLVAGAA